MYDAYVSGDLGRALEAWRRLLSLVKVYDYSTSYPTAVKTLLKLLKTPVKPYVRPPLTPEKPVVEENIKRIVEELGIPPLS
mgnify:CR=1 FL=1